MKKVSFNIEYAGLQLQVIKNANGEDVTPLKPISDLFGLNWSGQHKKITNDPFYKSYLGSTIVASYDGSGKKRDQFCILLSRVSAFLMTISPSMVRAQGNVSGADFLESKLNEWADAIHDFEELGVAININHYKNQELLLKKRRNLMALIGTKNKTNGKSERDLLTGLIKTEAENLGLNYQPDLIDDINQ